MRPSYAGSDYHAHRARKPVQALVPAGSGQTGRAPWIPLWIPLFALATVLSAATMAWLQGDEQPQPRNAVHAQLLRFRPALGDEETPAERFDRLGDAADAIVAASGGDLQVQAALVTIGWFESHWSQLVAEGRCSEYRWKCDHDPRTGKPRALSNFQLWAGACPELHDADGPPDELVAAKCAARLWRYGRARCGSDAGAFALYGTGSRCSLPDAERRASFMRRVLAAL